MSGRIPAAVAAFALILAACGGDDSSPTNPNPDPDPTGTVTVVLRTGMWPAPSGEGLVPEMPAVDQVDFAVATADSSFEASYRTGMDTYAQVQLDLPEAVMARIDCEALDAGGMPLFRSVTYRVLPADDDTLVANMADAADQTPPEHGGALTATVLGATEVELSWPMATDGAGPDPAVAYLVWAQPAAVVAKDLNAPTVAIPAGQTSVVVGGLAAGERHEFALAAIDPAGNVSNQTVVAGANLLATSACVWVDVATGSDGPGRGTYEQPCKTITYALSISSGEPVYVEAGTYSAATGEVFPLVLKDGTRLAGDIHWPTGRPQAVIEVGTTDAAITVPVNGTISGFVIRNPAGGMNYGIDAFTGNVRVDHVRIEGQNATSGIRAGARAHVSYCTVRGLYAGRGISFYGNEPKTAWSCLVEDCATGINIDGRDAFVHLSLVRDCTMGIVMGGLEIGDTRDILVSRTFVRSCANGFDIQKVQDLILANVTAYQCTQTGINMSVVDETVLVVSCHIDGSPVGISVRSGNPVIEKTNLVCNRVNLYVGGDGLVDATGNRWDHGSLVLYELEDEYDICPDSDICYDGSYSLTPLPLYTPTRGTTGCLNIGIMPRAPKALPAFLERVTPRTD
ncbi:MAG: DUF1565 domain-containing protein [bacterium]|nr:DUF1565 domain-containing protein [bacterium]